MKLVFQLPRLISVIPVENLYCHVEFMWGINVVERINNPVKRLLRETDDFDWVYKPRSDPAFLAMPKNVTKLIPLMIDGDQEQENTNDIKVEPRSQNPLDGLKYLSFLKNSMGKLSTGIMSPKTDDNEKTEFNVQRELKKFVLKQLVRFITLPDVIGSFQDNSSKDILDSTDDGDD